MSGCQAGKPSTGVSKVEPGPVHRRAVPDQRREHVARTDRRVTGQGRADVLARLITSAPSSVPASTASPRSRSPLAARSWASCPVPARPGSACSAKTISARSASRYPSRPLSATRPPSRSLRRHRRPVRLRRADGDDRPGQPPLRGDVTGDRVGYGLEEQQRPDPVPASTASATVAGAGDVAVRADQDRQRWYPRRPSAGPIRDPSAVEAIARRAASATSGLNDEKMKPATPGQFIAGTVPGSGREDGQTGFGGEDERLCRGHLDRVRWCERVTDRCAGTTSGRAPAGCEVEPPRFDDVSTRHRPGSRYSRRRRRS